ncbi:ATP-binding cassette domain-containing protein [Kribbella turkmenica]|uniref:ATP-binding cassette domain-containing protein n=1 Tax=Kribbella turkmenica TaxID=2530375 RepID=A0A4R4WEM5_9ACTN|nr:AAA family ATPase [Kribbella turkmenica]TDD16721.1 ATP-binding cassette domain-containing protein [Kribbella turkmenica]
MPFADHPVRRVAAAEGIRLSGHWPHTVPAVRQLLVDGLDLNPGVTFLVGENGAGKSTLVEAIAVAYGMSPEGGSTGARLTTRATESPLADELLLTRGVGGKRSGFFLRAETMHGFYTYLEQNPGAASEPVFHELSHGESFLSLIRSRFDRRGFYCLDEPESALSFSSSLAVVGVLNQLAESGSQVLCATHSPVIAALPGATILEVGEWGIRTTTWGELQLVANWKAYLQGPERYLRHVL